MAQHDFVLSNAPGLNFRSDLNAALMALITMSSGESDPADTDGLVSYPFQFWIDTSGAYPVLKQRNASNSAWVTIGRTDVEAFGLNGIVSGNVAPVAPRAFQYWVDTSGANPILKLRNASNTDWIVIGRADLANYGLLPLTGGVLSGPIGFSNADYIQIPVGTTAQRPAAPANGMIRLNTDLSTFEGYRNGAWAPIGSGRSTLFGTLGTPRDIDPAVGLTSAASHVSTIEADQVVFMRGNTSGQIAEVSAAIQIEAHTVTGARLKLINVDATRPVKLKTGNGLLLNGDWQSRELNLWFNGAVWEEDRRKEL